MEILQKYVVDGQSFDTFQEAEQYVKDNHDRVRLHNFIEHLRAKGAKRISASVTEVVEQFMAFENLTAESDDGEQEQAKPQTKAGKEVQSTDTGDSESEDTTEDSAPWVEESSTVQTGEGQEEKVEVLPGVEVSGAVDVKPSALAGITATEKSKNLFAKR